MVYVAVHGRAGADNKEYNLFADTLYYYEKTIKPENILNKDEFLVLCKEVGIK